MCGEKTSEKQFQTHCNHPNIGTGFGNHQQTDLRVFLTHQGNRKIAAEGNENGSYHTGQVIIVGIAGQGDRFIWWANSAGGNVPAGKIGYVRFRLPEDAEDGDVYVVNLSARSAGGKDARWTDNLTGLSGVPLTVGGSIRVGASGQTTTETTVSSGTTTTTAAVQSILYGDVNVDGRVDITDAVLLNKAVSGAVSFDSQQRSNGDCDVSGEINGTDAILLMQFLAHIIDTLPDRG